MAEKASNEEQAPDGNDGQEEMAEEWTEEDARREMTEEDIEREFLVNRTTFEKTEAEKLTMVLRDKMKNALGIIRSQDTSYRDFLTANEDYETLCKKIIVNEKITQYEKVNGYLTKMEYDPGWSNHLEAMKKIIDERDEERREVKVEEEIKEEKVFHRLEFANELYLEALKEKNKDNAEKFKAICKEERRNIIAIKGNCVARLSRRYGDDFSLSQEKHASFTQQPPGFTRFGDIKDIRFVADSFKIVHDDYETSDFYHELMYWSESK